MDCKRICQSARRHMCKRLKDRFQKNKLFGMRVFPYNKYESKMDGPWAHLLAPLCSRFLVAAVLLLFVLWSRVVLRVQRTRVSNCRAHDTCHAFHPLLWGSSPLDCLYHNATHERSWGCPAAKIMPG